VLTSETGEARIWSAFPLLPDGRLQVRYDKATQTVTWLGEEPVAANPMSQALSLPVAGGELTVIGSVPSAPDSEFYRQKAARLCTLPYTDRIIFQTGDPELYLTSGGIYQPSAVLFPVPGQLLFSLPIVIPRGWHPPRLAGAAHPLHLHPGLPQPGPFSRRHRGDFRRTRHCHL